ncbi:CLUMA_CG002941, isoform A [Clunio marinus]|uniref:CLUMA_CG002941, isoform A n=1 Tax=Clunio marinus TaxID=568069 RepID=A0A1J1HP58_9DIPT|nr:CLUMA_CG002941, isoform A [Clunio marinus]
MAGCEKMLLKVILSRILEDVKINTMNIQILKSFQVSREFNYRMFSEQQQWLSVNIKFVG